MTRLYISSGGGAVTATTSDPNRIFIASNGTPFRIPVTTSGVSLILDALVAQASTTEVASTQSSDPLLSPTESPGQISDIAVTQARSILLDSAEVLPVIAALVTDQVYDGQLSQIAAPAAIADITVSIGNVYNLLLDVLAEVPDLPPVVVDAVTGLTLEQAIAAGSVGEVALSQVYGLITEELGAPAEVADIVTQQAITLAVSETLSAAVIGDLTISVGDVYNLILGALDAATETANVTVSSIRLTALDAIGVNAGLDDISAGQAYVAVTESLSAPAPTTEVALTQLRQLALDYIAASVHIDDVATFEKALGLILNPKLIMVTPRRGVTNVTPVRRIVKH